MIHFLWFPLFLLACSCLVDCAPAAQVDALQMKPNTLIEVPEPDNEWSKRPNGFQPDYLQSNSSLRDQVKSRESVNQRTVKKSHETSEIKVKPEKRPPKIEIFELEQKFNSFCIHYRISGRPQPTKVWHLNGTVLEFAKFEGLKDKGYSNLNVNGTRYGAVKGENGDGRDGCLEIAAKSHFLSGTYRLTVRNELGEASEHKAVRLFSHPDPTTSVELDELTKGRTGTTPPPNEKTAGDSPIVFSVSINFLVLILALFFSSLLFYLACARYLRGQSRKQSSNKQGRVNRPGQMSLDLIRFVSFVDNPNYLAQREYLKMKGITHVESSRIQLIKDLGEGEFGRVYLGTISDPSDENEKTLVAVKVLKHTQQDELSEAFKEEAEVLSQIDHENIVKFRGISTDPFMMIFEYMQLGDLNSFLRNYDLQPDGSIELRKDHSDCHSEYHPSSESECLIACEEPASLTTDDLFSISIQVCNGMRYLAERKFVHRDLATRNCLVNISKSKLVVKIGDFGLSRNVSSRSNDYYKVSRNSAIPVRWYPPESIQYRKFSLESDIYSYAVLLWEVWTLGQTPFYELNNHQVAECVVEGKRPNKPQLCPPNVYELMKACWEKSPADRPTVGDLYEKLSEFRAESGESVKH